MRGQLMAAMALGLLATACSPSNKESAQNMSGTDQPGEGITISSEPFGELPDGRKVTRWTLANKSGASLTIMDLGATILTLNVPDRAGKLDDVVFGFDSAAPYLTDSPYFGAVVGRFANRIAKGKFTLDGQTYTLATNNNENHLHGGKVGFDKRVWKGEQVTTKDGPGVKFTLVSADGEEGYPGEVTASVTYVWTADNRLVMDYAATSTKATPFNISQHSYWNLGGAKSATTVLDHTLQIEADRYLPVDPTLIPTGELAAVEGTPFDFRKAKPIGKDIGATNEQLKIGGGFDHNWVLNGTGFKKAGTLTDPASGRSLEISTDEPGMQFYSGNFLSGKVTGKGGNKYPHRSAVALETQHFPDSPNQKGFPDAILSPGETYQSRTVFAFKTVK
jgi:aldose 1-epimerase